MLMTDYERLLKEAGFQAVVITDTGTDLNVYAQAGASACCSPAPVMSCCSTSTNTSAEQSQASPVHDGLGQVLGQFDANAYAASVRVYALASPSDFCCSQVSPAVNQAVVSNSLQRNLNCEESV